MLSQPAKRGGVAKKNKSWFISVERNINFQKDSSFSITHGLKSGHRSIIHWSCKKKVNYDWLKSKLVISFSSGTDWLRGQPSSSPRKNTVGWAVCWRDSAMHFLPWTLKRKTNRKASLLLPGKGESNKMLHALAAILFQCGTSLNVKARKLWMGKDESTPVHRDINN